jgi:predicted TIM-barrel fold metal-dependent hydrolase
MARPPEDRAIVPFPTHAVSNMEWVPTGITERQKTVERLIAQACADGAKRHGMSRAQFLRTAAATATAFMVLNKFYGSNAFAVKKEQCDDFDAARELLDKEYFVMDVQQHHVDLNLFPDGLGCFLRFRDRMAAGGCPASVGQANYVKEVFVDSETDVGVISGLPYGGVPLGPAAMIDTRDLVNELAGSERCIAQAVCDPTNEFANTRVEDMAGQVEKGARALKCYTYSGNWRLDDDYSASTFHSPGEQIAHPMLEEAQRLGLRLVNIHKGLPATFAPGSEETVRATDFPRAVRDFPKLKFCAYHSAYFGPNDDHPEGKGGLDNWEWLEVLASMPKKDRKRVYSEIGSTFAIMLAGGPTTAAHFIGKLLKALGPKNIIWGTDSIWWGSPQWLIDAFKALTIPEEMQEQFGYPALTEKTKRRILGLNAARVYGVKPKAKRCTLSTGQLAVYQGEQGGARAGRTLLAHGPTSRREFFNLLRAEQRSALG